MKEELKKELEKELDRTIMEYADYIESIDATDRFEGKDKYQFMNDFATQIMAHTAMGIALTGSFDINIGTENYSTKLHYKCVQV